MIKQISVFVDNKVGRLSEIADIMAANGIDIRALSIADTTDFGILRLIVNKPEHCCEVLRAEGITVSITSVTAVSIVDKPGQFAKVLDLLSKNNINVDYVYAFIGRSDAASVILKTSDDAAASKILSENGTRLLTDDEVYA